MPVPASDWRVSVPTVQANCPDPDERALVSPYATFRKYRDTTMRGTLQRYLEVTPEQRRKAVAGKRVLTRVTQPLAAAE